MPDVKGAEYVLDLAREGDTDTVYNLARTLQEAGEGFSEHEAFSRETVLEIIKGAIPHHYLITIKSLASPGGDIAAIMYSYVSPLARSSRPVLHDQWAMVNPEYAGLGLGRRATQEMSSVLLKAGYHAMMSDAFLTAPFAYRVNMIMGGVCVGVIPYGAYIKSHGWTDIMCLCRMYQNM
jgi:hypothetical protein